MKEICRLLHARGNNPDQASKPHISNQPCKVETPEWSIDYWKICRAVDSAAIACCWSVVRLSVNFMIAKRLIAG